MPSSAHQRNAIRRRPNIVCWLRCRRKTQRLSKFTRCPCTENTLGCNKYIKCIHLSVQTQHLIYRCYLLHKFTTIISKKTKRMNERETYLYNMGLELQNLSSGASDKARLKPVSSALEASQEIKISLFASFRIILSKTRITKALISLRGCAGWSASLLFANHRRQVFSRRGP